MWEAIYAVVISDRVDDDMMRCTCSRSHVIFFFTTYTGTRIRILSEPYVLFPRGHRYDDMRAFVFPYDIFLQHSRIRILSEPQIFCSPRGTDSNVQHGLD